MFLCQNDITDIHKKLINGENLPEDFPFITALSDNKKIFVIVQECRIDRLSDDKFTHFFPNHEPMGNNFISCLVRSIHSDKGYYINDTLPIPDSFKVCEAVFNGDKLVLKSEDNKTISFQMYQWNMSYGLFAFPELSAVDQIVTKEQLEQRFYNLPNVQKAVEKPNPKTKKRSYISVPNIGRMNYNDSLEMFEAVKHSVHFTIEDEHSEKALKISKGILKGIYDDLENFTDKIKIYAAKELLKTKNDSWLEEDEEPLTTEEFTQRITLSEINARSKNITVYLDDNDIFFGHTIVVFANAKCSFTSADILG